MSRHLDELDTDERAAYDKHVAVARELQTYVVSLATRQRADDLPDAEWHVLDAARRLVSKIQQGQVIEASRVIAMSKRKR